MRAIDPLFLLDAARSPLLLSVRNRVRHRRSCSETLTCAVESGEPTCQEDYLPTDDQRHLDGDIGYQCILRPAGRRYAAGGTGECSRPRCPRSARYTTKNTAASSFLYNCPEGCADEVAALTVFGPRERVIVTPDTDMKWKIAAAAGIPHHDGLPRHRGARVVL